MPLMLFAILRKRETSISKGKILLSINTSERDCHAFFSVEVKNSIAKKNHVPITIIRTHNAHLHS